MNMIKILFYIDELRAGGAEKVLCNLVNNMDPSSFDITVHTTWKSDAASLLNSNIRYKYVFADKSKVNRLRYRIEAQLGLFYQLHLKDNYDIEVAYLECGPTKVIASSTNKNAVHIAWIHCVLDRKFPDMKRFVQKTNKQYKRFDKVICVSEDCNTAYQKYFSDCAPSLVLHNVIDADEIRRKSKMKSDTEIIKNQITAIAVGRMSPEKNYMLLVKVYQQLFENGLVFDLWFVGDGPETARLKEYVRLNGLSDHIKFFGFQKNPYPIMKEADFLVCSSKFEGYSTVVVESMILNVPVVSVNCSGMNEILGDSEYGLITENSETGLKDGIGSFVQNTEIRAFYQKKAALRAEQLSGKLAVKKTECLFIKNC